MSRARHRRRTLARALRLRPSRGRLRGRGRSRGRSGHGRLTAVVENAKDILRVSDIPVSVLQNFDRVALSELAGLDPRQAIGFTQIRSGRLKQLTDMQLVANEAMRHSRKIMAYNQHQPRRRVPTDVETLQALVQQQLDERETMARAVVDFFGRSLPAGQDVYRLLDPPEGRPGRLRGHDRGASILEAPMRGDAPQFWSPSNLQKPKSPSGPNGARHGRVLSRTGNDRRL